MKEISQFIFLQRIGHLVVLHLAICVVFEKLALKQLRHFRVILYLQFFDTYALSQRRQALEFLQSAAI